MLVVFPIPIVFMKTIIIIDIVDCLDSGLVVLVWRF